MPSILIPILTIILNSKPTLKLIPTVSSTQHTCFHANFLKETIMELSNIKKALDEIKVNEFEQELLDHYIENDICYQFVWFTEWGDWSWEPNEFREDVDVFKLVLPCGLTVTEIQQAVDDAIWS
jgi:hypothetical protein